MTTITATVNPDRASVALVLIPSATVSSILRHDANGIQEVRVPMGTFPTSRRVQIDDWEASLRGPVTYTSGDAAEARVVLAGTGPWLTPPLAPSASVPLVSVLDYDASRDSTTSIQALAGGGAVIKLGELGKRSGTFGVLCADHGVAAHLEDLLARYPQQLLRVPDQDSLDLYLVCTGTKVSPDPETGLWRLDVNYAETLPPASGLPTWTYAALAEAYPSLGAASAAYRSLAGLAVNNREL